MDDLILEATKRNALGKKVSKLRRQGITPAHLFGHNIESLALQCDTTQLRWIIAHAGMTRLVSLEIDGEKRAKSVFIREIQRDAIGKKLLHVDFYQVKKGEKLEVDIPIVLVGEAPAMKAKGRMLTHGVTSLSIRCLPENVPPQIEVDISSLEELDQAIHVKDIVLDGDITVNAEPDQLVVKVTEALVKEEVTVVEEEEEVEEGAEAVAEAKEAPEQPAGESPPEAE